MINSLEGQQNLMELFCNSASVSMLKDLKQTHTFSCWCSQLCHTQEPRSQGHPSVHKPLNR